MLELAAASKERHERFVKRIVAAREVWGLKSEDGWACTASTAHGSKGRSVMPFWSDRAYAKQCAKEDWSHYEPTPIPLELFLECWLPGMDSNDCIVGTNWNVHLCGYEIDPPDLKQELERELENVG
jgi:hypothetical protein